MKTREFADVERLLQAKLPELRLKGRLLFYAPIGHTLRAILFDESSFDSRMFFVHVFAQPMFMEARHLVLNLGWRVGGEGRWHADDPALVMRLHDALKSEALPFLSRLHSPRDVATEAMALHKSQDPIVQQTIVYAFARSGEAEPALAAMERLVTLLDPHNEWQRQMLLRMETLSERLLQAPTELMASLEAQEQETIARLGLGPFR